VELRTARLSLRPLGPDDAEAVHAYRGRADVTAYLVVTSPDLDAARERLAAAAMRWCDPQALRFDLAFAVVLDGTVIGDVSAWNLTDDGEATSPDPAEVYVGYALHPDHQGHGYATEAVARVLDWLAERGATTAYANLFTANAPSLALLRRLGFVQDETSTAEEDTSGHGLPSLRMRGDIRRNRGPG
jgi:[ribosomal protein S5]-alanine N-acetyltransferase